MQYTGSQSIVFLLIQVIFIVITFNALQSFHFQSYFRRPPQGLPILIVLVSITIGAVCGWFFTSFFQVLHGALTMFH